MSTLDLFRLDGRRAGVTGASWGLGRFMALALADAGADVVITGRTQETLDATAGEIRANLTSCFLGTKLIGDAVRARNAGSRIINIASISAMIVNRGIGGRDYETAKAAVVHFTRCAAADWAQYGITVNAICSGLFMTDVNRQ